MCMCACVSVPLDQFDVRACPGAFLDYHAYPNPPPNHPCRLLLLLKITEHLDEEEGEDVEVYFAPQDPESRKSRAMTLWA